MLLHVYAVLILGGSSYGHHISNIPALAAALLLAAPQILRRQFRALLGSDTSSDIRRGGGPTFLFLAIVAAALCPDAACDRGFGLLSGYPDLQDTSVIHDTSILNNTLAVALQHASILQNLGWATVAVAVAATCMAPDADWPPAPFSGARAHAVLQIVTTALLAASLALQV